MIVVIAGSRGIEDYGLLCMIMERLKLPIKCVVSGTARGPDKMGERWAAAHNVAVLRMPADWKKHKKAAGPIRNAEMAEACDVAVILWDGESSGTKNMIQNMKKLNKPYYVFLPDGTKIEI
jgi:uncharacterized phage-like protein YoqJ